MEAKKERLFDILNSKKGASIEIEGVTLEFRKFTIADMMSMQKDGINLEDLDSAGEKGVELLAKAIYNQLTDASQCEFGVQKDFAKCLTMPLFTKLSEVFFSMMTDSKPVETEEEKK